MTNFQVKIAQTEEEKKQVYRLRHDIFLKELGGEAHLFSKEGIETDIYDELCEHVIIIDKTKGAVIGTYRLLPGAKADEKVGFYAEKIFDIKNIKSLDSGIMEVGRSCVHKDYREGAVINLLWKGIAEYVKQNNIKYLFGSVRLYTSEPSEVSEIFIFLKENFYSPQGLRARPLKKFPGLRNDVTVTDNKEIFLKLPPLMKGYLRLGLKICGPPAWNNHLTSVVFLMALDINEITPVYRKHFLGF